MLTVGPTGIAEAVTRTTPTMASGRMSARSRRISVEADRVAGEVARRAASPTHPRAGASHHGDHEERPREPRCRLTRRARGRYLFVRGAGGRSFQPRGDPRWPADARGVHREVVAQVARARPDAELHQPGTLGHPLHAPV